MNESPTMSIRNMYTPSDEISVRDATSQHVDQPSGVLVVDKPEGVTSFSVVAGIKKCLKSRKVGHCGTLDPFATGVLVICVNDATRISDQLLNQRKTYRFSIRLGIETDTQDRTGVATRSVDGPVPSEEALSDVLARFRGSYVQRVPRFAAVKVKGKRLYELSRSGVEVDLPAREVHIHELRLLAYEWPEATLEAECSKGTYIRRLASDIGAQLGCGAHVKELRRLASGGFRVDGAMTPDELKAAIADGTWREKLVSENECLSHLPGIVVESEQALDRLRNGCLEPEIEFQCRRSAAVHGTPVRLVTPGGRLAALCRPLPAEQGKYRLKVFSF